MRWFPVILAPFVSLLIVVVGFFLLNSGRHTRSLVQAIPGGVITTGHVVQVIVDDGGSRYGSSFSPIVDFQDQAGAFHEFQGPFSLSAPTVGESTRVSYDPSNPDRAHDLSDGSVSWRVPYDFGVGSLLFGSVLTIPAVVLVVRSRKRRRGVLSDSSDTLDLRAEGYYGD